jgi:hypothetical protein
MLARLVHSGAAPRWEHATGTNRNSPCICSASTWLTATTRRTGTYWGGGRGTPALWCAFSADGLTRIYVRASSRAAALDKVREDRDELRFIRGA